MEIQSSSTPRSAQPPQILEALRSFFEPGQVYELRALKTRRGVASGYFDDLHAMAAEAECLSGQCPGVYFGLNPVNPALLARASNRVVFGASQTTADSDVQCRRWLMLDFDPVRPAGISSTDVEHEAALDRARTARETLRGARWPDPAFVDSGNGAHLLCRVDLPNDDESRVLVRQCLEALAPILTDAVVSLDTGVFNAARLARVPGTLNAKGENLPERPHRVARLLDVPTELKVVDRALLEALAATRPQLNTANNAAAFSPGMFRDADAVTAMLEEHGIAIAATKPWQGGVLFDLETCPFDPTHHRTARVIRMPSGAMSFGCFHASCSGRDWRALRILLEPSVPKKSKKAPRRLRSDGGEEPEPSNGVTVVPVRGGVNYFVSDGCLWYEKEGPSGVYHVKLTTFEARIAREMEVDDGAEKCRRLTIEGRLNNGTPLEPVTLAAENFPSMSWVLPSWGSRAMLEAGPSIKEHVRTAIQMLSSNAERCSAYGHLGWRRIGGKWFFLMVGGGIGEAGLDPRLEVLIGDARFSRYSLPDQASPEALVAAIQASLYLYPLSSPEIMFPLLGATYLAPLAEIMPIDFSIFLKGPTGCQKSELVALAQQHFGASLDSRNLPANWSSTANALERQAFIAKDAVLVVDDFVPTGARSDIDRLHRDADRLLRAQGNLAGRGRMFADGSLRPMYYPRGLIISTGEDIPRGPSLGARLLILECANGMVDLPKLTHAQKEARAGTLACAMAGYVQWLAPQMDELRTRMRARKEELRQRAREELRGHDRTPDIVAGVLVGWECFLKFAFEMGAVLETERDAFAEEAWKHCILVAGKQAAIHKDQDPVERFLQLLRSAVSSGRGHLANPQSGERPEDPKNWGWRSRPNGTGGDEWEARGPRLGWVTADVVLLDLEAAYAAVQSLAETQGDRISYGKRTVAGLLKDKNALAKVDPRQTTSAATIQGHLKRVLHLKIEFWLGDTTLYQ